MTTTRCVASLYIWNERGRQIRNTVLNITNKWKVSSVFESIFMVNYKCTRCQSLLNRNLLRYTLYLRNMEVKLIDTKREIFGKKLCYIKIYALSSYVI